MEALEDNYMEELEHDPMVSEQCKKTPKYPTKEWIIARVARSVTNNDVIKLGNVNVETETIADDLANTATGTIIEKDDADQKESDKDEHLLAPELKHLLADINQIEVDGTNAIETVQQEEANSPREIKQHKETNDADQKDLADRLNLIQ